ncbi:MAG: DUF192 domain-containing protein [Patescibacteria group bacterium]
MNRTRFPAGTEILVSFILLVFVGAGCDRTKIALPDGTRIRPEVARTPDKLAQGLSGREDIGDGMLFCFTEEKIQAFWMLDMYVPIDMVWLKDGVVVGVSERVPIREFNDWSRRWSPEPVDAVLELASGDALKHKIITDSIVSDINKACK